MPKKKSIQYPQDQSLKPFWCVLVKESQLRMKNDHIPSAHGTMNILTTQKGGYHLDSPGYLRVIQLYQLKVLIMYVTNISLEVQIEVVRNFETHSHHQTNHRSPLILFFLDHLSWEGFFPSVHVYNYIYI